MDGSSTNWYWLVLSASGAALKMERESVALYSSKNGAPAPVSSPNANGANKNATLARILGVEIQRIVPTKQ